MAHLDSGLAMTLSQSQLSKPHYKRFRLLRQPGSSIANPLSNPETAGCFGVRHGFSADACRRHSRRSATEA